MDSAQLVRAPIVGGTTASAYPESALIEMSVQGVLKAACSGTVVAPQVVLTAGHCVDTFTGWSVQAPFLNQSATSTAGETFDWKSDGTGHVDPNRHDVGLVYLDRAITAPTYPALADAPVPDGGSIVNIGRIDNGTLSNSALFVSKALTVTAAGPVGFPFDYVTDQVIESGDSGGPVEVPGASPHTVVAVNSGAGGGTEVLARVDLVKSWINDRIAAHGGGGAAAPPAWPAPAPAPPASCAGSNEVEPNDDFRTPNPLGAVVCGGLAGADNQDWYGWSIDGATPYTVNLAATGDANLAMWKLVNGAYARVQNTSLTEITHTSSGAGSYVLAVFTPSGAAQSYTLTLSK